MVASGVAGLVVVTLVAVTLHTSRSIYALSDSVSMNSQSRYAIDRMSQKIRQATNVTSFSATALSVRYKGRPLSYGIVNGTLVEVDNGQTNRLVKNCNALTFSLYKRNPVTNSFDQFPILTATNEAKVVQLSWQCGTTRVGRSAGTGELFSAKIVLRAK